MQNAEVSILLVDDDPLVLLVTELALEVHGYKAHTVKRGTDAVELITNNPTQYRIVLLDLMMRDLNGYEVLTELSEIIKENNISVIIHSGIKNNFEVEKAKYLGAKGFIAKPLDIEELINVIKQYENP